MLKAGLIGYGGISKSHRMAYKKLEALGKVKLVCAYDIDPTAFDRKIEINIDSGTETVQEDYRFYTSLDEMLSSEELDFVDVCAPSFVHRELSCKLLRKGYHVLCEKPMALSYADCREMILAAKENNKELMIGQCLRFFPEVDYIKDAIADLRFGKPIGAFFSRLSAPPIWGWDNWFMDPSRSGGCVTDLHIHDVDLVRYLFGEPEAISCRASTSICKHDTVHTTFHYGSIPITAIGDWTLTGIKFNASARFDFEQATVTLAYDHTLTVYPKNGDEPYTLQFEKISGQFGEISYFCDVIEGKIQNTKNTPESAARTVQTVEILRESADRAGSIISVEQ